MRSRFVDDVDYVPIPLDIYVPDLSMWHRLAGAEDNEPSASIFIAAQARLAKERIALENNTVDSKVSIEYRLGYINALKWLMSLPRSAREALSKETNEA